MDLRERLARLDPLSRRPEAADTPARPVARDAYCGLRDALALVPTTTAAGEAWLRERTVPGLVPPPWPPADLSGILPAAGALPAGWHDVLLLDTETTGVAGGTGTLAFLVGLGWWQGDDLVVRQIFLPGPHLEPPLLAALDAVTARFGVVVTYNGAAFDLPLLRTRARLNRRGDPCRDLVSWDLLPAARRLWGRQLPDCRQQTVEERICGRGRGPGDIAGALIPGVYLDYLHHDAVPPLEAVLHHNHHDIAGLARVLAALCAGAATVDAGPEGWTGPAAAAWSSALVCERRRQRPLAAAWAEWLVAGARLDELPLGGVLDVVRQLKRTAAWRPAAAAIAHGLERWPRERRLHYEAAVLYEHRLGDPGRALGHAAALHDEKRLARLRDRLARWRTGTLATTGARAIVRADPGAGGAADD